MKFNCLRDAVFSSALNPVLNSVLNRVLNLVLGAALLTLAGCQVQEPPMAYGTLERERVLLTATQTELITEVGRQKGQPVKRGDLLLQLDDTVQQLKVAKAKAQLQQLEATLSEAQNGSRPEQLAAAKASVKRAEASLADAKRQLARAKKLRADKLLAQASLDQNELAVRLAQAEQTAAEQRYTELKNGVRSEQIQQLSFARDGAEQSLRLEQKALADLTIRASRDGLLEDLPYQLGERVPQGAVLAVLAAKQSAYARVYLPQRVLAHFKVGQQVNLQVDGVSTPLEGQVRFIAAEASFTPYYALNQHERSNLMFVTEISLPAQTELPAGLPVQLLLPEAP